MTTSAEVVKVMGESHLADKSSVNDFQIGASTAKTIQRKTNIKQ
jgi:hypothetical protein